MLPGGPINNYSFVIYLFLFNVYLKQFILGILEFHSLCFTARVLQNQTTQYKKGESYIPFTTQPLTSTHPPFLPSLSTLLKRPIPKGLVRGRRQESTVNGPPPPQQAVNPRSCPVKESEMGRRGLPPPYSFGQDIYARPPGEGDSPGRTK